MDNLTAKIQNKMSKIENSLLELNKEIFTAMQFLQNLEKHSIKIVRKLSSISSPAAYFKEFVNVHSFIMKYLSFVTEINCTFEMLEVSGISCHSIESLKFSETFTSSADFFRNDENVADSIVSEVVEEGSIKTDSSSSSTENLRTNKSESFCKVDLDNNKSEELIRKNENCIQTEMKTDLNSYSDFRLLNEKHFQTALTKKKSQSDSLLSFQRDFSVNDEVEKRSMYSDFVADIDNDKDLLTSNNSVVPDALPSEVKCSESVNDTVINEKNPEHNQSEEIVALSISRKVGVKYEVEIAHINSPSEFYVYIFSEQYSLFFELKKKLKQIPANFNKISKMKNENKKNWLSQQTGFYVLFYSKCDETWYRAKVTNWCLPHNDDLVCIFLLDSGESKCVSISNLEPMPDFLKQYPAFCQRCHLYDIFPLDVDKNTLHWGKESGEKMKTLTENSKKLTIKIAPVDDFHPVTSLPVILWLEDNSCINQLLVNCKLAVQGAGDHKFENEVASDKLKDWNPMKEDFESYQNSYDLNVNDPAAYIYGYVGKDYERICKHFANTGYCFKGQSCRKEHKQLDPLGFTTDQEEIYINAFNTLKAPPPETVLNVHVTCISNINQFCCIQENQNCSPDEENLQTLNRFMNKTENIRDMKKLLIPPAIGQTVIARYSEDHRWYRARVLESQPEKDLYLLAFVDYGNTEILPLSEIRAMENRYLHLPFQAIYCFIYGIDENSAKPMEESINYLNEKISKGIIKIEVVANLPGKKISLLVNVFDGDGNNIGADLIDKKYALPKQEITISSETDKMPG